MSTGTHVASSVSAGGSEGASNRLPPKTLRLYRLVTLVLLCLSDGTYTILRRYSRGVLRETFSIRECLLLAEVIKTVFSARVVCGNARKREGDGPVPHFQYLLRLVASSRKMLVLAAAYLVGNILSYYALERVGAGTFAVVAQGKTFTTAMFAVLMLRRTFSWNRWRAMATQVAGVVLFVLPTLESRGTDDGTTDGAAASSTALAGIAAEVVVVTLSGAASIYFEKTIKNDPTDIWERNFQLGFHSTCMYGALAVHANHGGLRGLFADWTPLALVLSCLSATGGLLVALSIKYGDSVLKTLAISGSLIYAAVFDRLFLGGPLNLQMILAAVVVIVSIINYTFDPPPPAAPADATTADEEAAPPPPHKGAECRGSTPLS